MTISHVSPHIKIWLVLYHRSSLFNLFDPCVPLRWGITRIRFPFHHSNVLGFSRVPEPSASHCLPEAMGTPPPRFDFPQYAFSFLPTYGCLFSLLVQECQNLRSHPEGGALLRRILRASIVASYPPWMLHPLVAIGFLPPFRRS